MIREIEYLIEAVLHDPRNGKIEGDKKMHNLFFIENPENKKPSKRPGCR
jgi:hypothetical protein